VVTKKIGRRRPGIEARGSDEAITDHLFPNPSETVWSQVPPLDDDEQHAQDFTSEEILDACKRLATDLEGIPNEVLLLV